MSKKSKRKFFDKTYVKDEKRKPTILICILLWSLLMTWFVYGYVLGSVTVKGKSMMPNLIPSQWKIYHKWPYWFSDPKQGDVVVAEDPFGGPWLVKRIIALPGQQVQIKNGGVFVDGRQIQEGYLTSHETTDGYRLGEKTYEVAASHYFLLGDNRDESEDSRHFGAVAREAIKGRMRI